MRYAQRGGYTPAEQRRERLRLEAAERFARGDWVTTYLDADVRDPEKILRQAAATLDFSQPMALLLMGILHGVGDEFDPYGIVRGLVEAMPGGSYLAINHLTADIYRELTEFAAALNEREIDAPLVLRDHAQVASFFDGLEIVEPGVVQLSKWRPESDDEAAAPAALWGGGGPQAGLAGNAAALRVVYVPSILSRS